MPKWEGVQTPIYMTGGVILSEMKITSVNGSFRVSTFSPKIAVRLGYGNDIVAKIYIAMSMKLLIAVTCLIWKKDIILCNCIWEKIPD